MSTKETKIADDIKLLKSLRTSADCEILSRHLVTLSDWAINVRLNSVCLNVIHMGMTSPNFIYECYE